MIFSEKPGISFLYMDTHSQQSRRNDDFLSFHSISFSLRLHKFYLATFRRDFTVGVGETWKIPSETYKTIHIRPLDMSVRLDIFTDKVTYLSLSEQSKYLYILEDGTLNSENSLFLHHRNTFLIEYICLLFLSYLKAT